ncbi:MAG: glycosyltransferase family 39 protein, partial [Anaerolineae bacterium]
MSQQTSVPARSGLQATPRLAGLDRWLLVALILLAFGRGIWQLGTKSLWWDESLSLHRAQGSLPYVLSNKIVLTDTIYDVDTIDNHPPLYFLILWGTVRLLGQSESALRFPSLIFAMLLVPLLYVTGRRLVDRWAGLGAAALAALSPMYLWYGQEARPYTLLALLSLLSFYLFVRIFFGPSGLADLRRRWLWLVAYGLVTVGLVLTHHLSILLIGFQLLVLGLAVLQRARRNRTFLIVVAGVAVVAAASAIYAFVTLPRPRASAGYRFVPLWEILRDVWNSFSLGLSVDVGDWYVLLIDLVFLLFLVVGFLRLVRPGTSRRWHRSGWLLVGYLAMPIAAIYALSFFQPAYMNSRHLILITPAFYLLLASGLTLWRGRTWAVGLLAWLIIIGGTGYSTYNYFANPAYDKDHHRQWGDYLREHVRPGDVVIVDPPHIETLYHYYADTGVPWVGLPLLSASRPETVAKMEELLQTYDRVWLAFSNTPPWGDRRRFPEAWLNENAFRVFYQHFPSYASIVMVAGYLPDWPHVAKLPDDATPVPVRYTPALRLDGYRLVSSPEPGERLHVQLFWSTDELGPEQVSALLRLVDAEGHVLSQDDQCPFNGLYPMWQWQPELILQDEHEVSIPAGTPPGDYRLELTLLSRPNGCAEGSGPAVPPQEAPTQAQQGDGVLLGTINVPPAGDAAARHDLNIAPGSTARYDGLTLLASQVSPLELGPNGRTEIVLSWEAE